MFEALSGVSLICLGHVRLQKQSTVIEQQARSLAQTIDFHALKAFIVKQLEEVLRMHLLTGHKNKVYQKPARLLSV